MKKLTLAIALLTLTACGDAGLPGFATPALSATATGDCVTLSWPAWADTAGVQEASYQVFECQGAMAACPVDQPALWSPLMTCDATQVCSAGTCTCAVTVNAATGTRSYVIVSSPDGQGNRNRQQVDLASTGVTQTAPGMAGGPTTGSVVP